MFYRIQIIVVNFFYFKFVYLLRAMKRNIEEYHDDFLNKLRYHKVKNWVRYYPRKGRDLHDIAAHCNEIEGSLGLHKSGVDDDSDADEDGECEHGEYSSHSGSGGHGAMALSFTRADQWCLEEGTGPKWNPNSLQSGSHNHKIQSKH